MKMKRGYSMALLPVEIYMRVHKEFGSNHSEEIMSHYYKIMEAISKGNTEVMLGLAVFYEQGCPEWNIEKDILKSSYWNYMAAKQGDALGAYRYGRNFLIMNSDNGQLADVQEKGMRYIIDAANAGITAAQQMAGIAYMNGWGVNVSYQKAYDYLTEAIKNGCSEAQGDLDILLRKM